MTALIISIFVGIALCTAGTLYMFRRELDRQSNALWTCIHDQTDKNLVEVKNHVQRYGMAVRDELAGARAELARLSATDYSDVLRARNEFLELISGLHTKIDAIPAAAEAAVHNAAAASINSARRTCQWCSRTVHSFVVEAGVVKCTDCKAKTASN